MKSSRAQRAATQSGESIRAEGPAPEWHPGYDQRNMPSNNGRLISAETTISE